MGFKKLVLVGVSGGPDSMYLLYKINKSLLFTPIALHVNYNKRPTAQRDQQLVESFCKKHNIKLYAKNVTTEEWDKYSFYSGFQAKAREIRFRYFEMMSKKIGTNTLMLGHQRDDFLETAIMQDERSNDYLFFGIEKKSFHHNLNILRPLIKKDKQWIEEQCRQHRIAYGIDETNLEQQYERNKVRFDLMHRSKLDKKEMFKYFNGINKSKEGIRNKVEKLCLEWEQNSYSYLFFKQIEDKYKKYIIYKWLILSSHEININSNKINGILEFLLEKNPTKNFRLTDNLFIQIVNDNIIIINNEKVQT